MAAELYTASWERFHEGCRVYALAGRNQRREFVVEDAWPHKGLVVLKFRGIATISQAEMLIGCEIQVPRSERLSLSEGEVYVSDLVGCTVFDHGAEVGQIAEVRFSSGDAPLLVVKAGTKEYLLPFAGAYLVKVDTGHKRIEMELPEGMLEL